MVAARRKYLMLKRQYIKENRPAMEIVYRYCNNFSKGPGVRMILIGS